MMNSHGMGFTTKATLFDGNGNIKEIQEMNPFKNVKNNSRIIIGDKEFPFRSFVKNFGVLVNAIFGGAEVNPFVRETGADFGSGSWSPLGVRAGSGTTAVAQADYILDTMYAEGAGADQLNYAAVASGSRTATGSAWEYYLSSNATNNSGSELIIRELGWLLDSFQGYDTLFARDVLGTPVAIANSSAKKLKYVFSWPYTTTAGWTQNMSAWCIEGVSVTGTTYGTDTSGASTAVDNRPGDETIYVGANNSTYGIRIGTGGDDYSTSDYTLQSLIDHGSTDTTANYFDCTPANGLYTPPTVDGDTAYFQYGREFQYVGSTTLTVQEYDIVSSTQFQYLRGIFSSPIVMEPSDRLRVEIRMQHEV